MSNNQDFDYVLLYSCIQKHALYSCSISLRLSYGITLLQCLSTSAHGTHVWKNGRLFVVGRVYVVIHGFFAIVQFRQGWPPVHARFAVANADWSISQNMHLDSFSVRVYSADGIVVFRSVTWNNEVPLRLNKSVRHSSCLCILQSVIETGDIADDFGTGSRAFVLCNGLVWYDGW